MPKEYTVRQGDCLNSISEKHGLFWQTLWDDPGNKALKDRRKDPNVLQPGDILTIPDKREKNEDCSSDSKHRFRKKGVPAKMKVQLVIEDEPIKNQPYSMMIDDQFWSEGTTDGDGYLETAVPPQVKTGKIIVGPPDNRISFSVDFGTLDPLDTEDGALQRLRNMGYEVGEDPRGALESFQEKEDLTVTGELNQATRDRIKEVFGQ
ncbi:MAG TPA: LysM domain-containing protein [Deltaproteobacteria bacterium]|nr:LysM domain-containing protein [Deltaproteobacteria bacterium]